MKINFKYVFIQKFISVFIPLFLVFTCHSFLSEILPNTFSFDLKFILISFVSLFFSTLTFSVIDVLKLKNVSKTRIVIFALIFIYLILVIFNKKSFPQRFILDGKSFYILFINFIYWLLDFYFESTFFVWNYFLEISEGKSGESLYRTLREDEVLMEKSVNAIRSLKTISLVFIYFIAFIILISWLNSYKFSLRSICFFISMICMHFFLVAYIKNSLDELRFGGMGIVSIFQFALKRLIAVFVILAMCFLIAITISPGKKIIDKNFQFQFDESFIVKIISIFSNLFPDGSNELHKTMHEELPDVLLPSMGDSGITDEDRRQMYVNNTDNIDNFNKIVNIIIISVVSILFILFLFLPLFSKKFRNFIKEKKLIKILKSFVNNFKDFICNLFKIKNNNGIKIHSEKKLYSEFIKKTTKETMSKEKKKEIGEFAKIFFKLVSFGEENGILLTESMTPMNYINLLCDKFFDKKDILMQLGFLFEKALYSKECLSEEEKLEYKNSYERFCAN